MTSHYVLQPIFDDLENLTRAEIPSVATTVELKADYQQGVLFLQTYRVGSTFITYRTVLETFFQWCWFVSHKTLVEIKRPDIEAFIEFCQRPPLNWIGTESERRYIIKNNFRLPNPDWKPFVVRATKVMYAAGMALNASDYHMSYSKTEAFFRILNSFYSFLLDERYVTINPLRQIRQKGAYIRKSQNSRVIRRLSPLQWEYMFRTTQEMTIQDPAHERTLFLISILYGMYLRISEVCASKRWVPQMQHFYKDRSGNVWFKVVGKGNKERNIAVSDGVVTALARYRTSMNLPPFPLPGESRPLFLDRFNPRIAKALTSTRYIRKIVQKCFNAAIIKLREDGYTDDADQLGSATVHWLRHTGISDDVKIRPREHVRDDAGHSSSSTTDRYIDIQLSERHASARNKTLYPK
jgi:site-specific recombinase XerD